MSRVPMRPSVAEAAHHMALEMREHEEGIVVEHGLADVHLLKPLAALDRQRGHALGVGDVDGAEGPAVDLQRLAVLLGRVAAALVIGVGLDDRGLGQAGRQQLLDPGARNDVGALGLAGVQLHGHLPAEDRADLVVDFLQSLLGQIARKEDDRALARALFIGDVAIAVLAGDRVFYTHGILLPFHSLCYSIADDSLFDKGFSALRRGFFAV